MTRADLLALAARVEAAQGHDRSLVKDIARAVGKAPSPVVTEGYGWREDAYGWVYVTGEDIRTAARCIHPEPWLTSLDAAASLAGDDWCGLSRAVQPDMGGKQWCATIRAPRLIMGRAATPALALTAAALRAIAEGVQQ